MLFWSLKVIPSDNKVTYQMRWPSTRVEQLSIGILNAMPESTLKCPQHDESQLLITACIQDEICLKNRLRCQWQITTDAALKAKASDPPARVGEQPLELQC